MNKRNKRDLLEDHQEWVDHMYNPGYWINRPSLASVAWWRYVRRHNRIFGLLGMISNGLLLLTIWKPLFTSDLPSPEIPFALMQATGMSLLIGFLFIASLILCVQSADGGDSQNKEQRHR